ncbi:hypothetical protein LJU02_07785 [Corynebacterium pseudotuberculosis]|uniref:Secreted protein n=2 Tax=Corynebacterium pseudotuberculosis TaxID=1719 RepID=D9QBT2_CORP2|nr:hypothetical protein [Corynebacterium pseudotuberculosis]AER69562.1 Hypothetical protein Cp106_1504 [Corynebacterium pseudotuberculosis 1/06-A]ADK29342.1 hypothetical protein CPFRC_07780 [Corynebacterium pseudotuberculosis FRC41]ADL11008.1 hypothetical protein CPC231_07780 [Corynebacterium pseudotuberculosis C231]ADL21410.1 hypothetical protein CP1002_05365 [Corynebacterium pseudotuberculosis 1002]ADO26807.1 hypothetical protein CPI19_03740 [Corynebacterium pseudotuberculosis I19]
MRISRSRLVVGALVGVATLTLSACGGDDVSTTVSVTPTTSTPVQFQPKQVAPVKVDHINAPETDPGLNVKWEILGTSANSQGAGSVIYVKVTNLNDLAVPKDAFPAPTLRVNGADMPQVDAGTVALDLPLGAGASTNLQYAFNTSYGTLYDATFQIGNAIFEGNLNSI